MLNIDEILQPLIANPAAANAKFKLVWVSCGKQDFLHAASQQLVETLTKGGIRTTYRESEGAHVWSVWRNNLNDAAPLLFPADRR
jgi:enterochelin esterase family protein